MESEDSDHTSLMINCPVMRCFEAHWRHMMICIHVSNGILEQKITISWCIRADISDSLATLYISGISRLR